MTDCGSVPPGKKAGDARCSKSSPRTGKDAGRHSYEYHRSCTEQRRAPSDGFLGRSIRRRTKPNNVRKRSVDKVECRIHVDPLTSRVKPDRIEFEAVGIMVSDVF